MLVLPPKDINFTLGEIIHPTEGSIKTGMIAPGMGTTISILFTAPSLSDFDSVLEIKTEETGIFEVPLYARREPPNLNIANELFAGTCWTGDRIDTAWRITNLGGEASFKFFSEEDLIQQQADNLSVSTPK